MDQDKWPRKAAFEKPGQVRPVAARRKQDQFALGPLSGYCAMIRLRSQLFKASTCSATTAAAFGSFLRSGILNSSPLAVVQRAAKATRETNA